MRNNLIVKAETYERRGLDTFLRLKLSEIDGSKSVVLEVTLHNISPEKIEILDGGMEIITKEGAPLIVNIRKPAENMV